MAKAGTLVGLDVHAAKIVAAVLDGETGEVAHFRMSGLPATEGVQKSPNSAPAHGFGEMSACQALISPGRCGWVGFGEKCTPAGGHTSSRRRVHRPAPLVRRRRGAAGHAQSQPRISSLLW